MTAAKTSLSVKHDIAVLRFANPPVNSLGLELRRAIEAGIDDATRDPQVNALILIGSAAGFSAGADIGEFGTHDAAAQPNLAALIDMLETSPKPVIAAISGVCMGGGLELALACHYRVAAAGTKIALPEVKLGILPGAGGTQRLPRLIGAEAALNMIVSGAAVSSEHLRTTALFDSFADGDLLDDTLAFVRRVVDKKRPLRRVRDLRPAMPNHEAYFQFARQSFKAARYPAPGACVDAVAAAFDRPFAAGMQRERELFASLLSSPESASLRHVFQAERAASRIIGLAKGTSIRPIRRVGVIGAGTMGGGITSALINAGLPVVLLETTQQALDHGIAAIRRNYQGALRKGTLTEALLEQRMALVTPTLDYHLLADVDLAIEAVFESLEVKRQVFERLDQILQQDAILASNTSALNLNTIAGFTRRPQYVIGLHFFSPANVMRLLEIVRGTRTADGVLATCVEFAKKLGKIAVVSGVCEGFIGNRMIARYLAAAHELLMEGALPHQVDAALQTFGLAMGPFRMSDLAGLDIGWAARKRCAAELPGRDGPNVADALCEAGRFGQKAGAGWYRYDTGSRTPGVDPEVTVLIGKFREQQGVTPRPVSDEEIVERCVYALVNEGARILADDIAQRSSDVDIVYLNGYGFPPWRGGPMFYADQIGLRKVVRALRHFADLPGVDRDIWMPAPLLLRLAQEGKTFSEHEGRQK
jgi:3-hydroxyacyl-CoA dehydrogenase